ncbi:MAG: hypothetical protein AAGB03_04870 [Pseudomonadota bacterium]
MTSEVLLMNRSAVAMAADSAVTITSDQGQKIYQSVDKVFQLIDDRPIGIMIYNNAEIMNVPWETIISLYREEAAGKSFDTIEGYAADFFLFIDNNLNLFPQDHQDFEFYRIVATIYGHIASTYDDQIKLLEEAGDGDLALNHTSIFEFVVNEFHRIYTDPSRDSLACFSPDLGRRLEGRYREEVTSLIDYLIGFLQTDSPKLQVSDKTRSDLFDLAILSITKDAFFEGFTGIVIAGFGKKDKFPSMASYYTSGVIDGTLKRSLEHQASVDAASGPVVMTFAHDDMIHTLMTGMDRTFRGFVFQEALRLTTSLVQDLIETLPGLTAEQKAALFSKYSEENLRHALSTFFDTIEDYQTKVHTVPIVQAIHNLPRMELAETAASLVRLNSFQQKVTHQPETVGGPVDVALISRTDGFVLIRDIGVGGA